MRFPRIFPASAAILVGWCCGLGGCGADRPAPPTVTVFAAASAKDALEAVGEALGPTLGIELRFSFDGSGTLARQVMAGAPADLFLSADDRWMDEAERAGAIDAASRLILLENDLVLIAPASTAWTVELARGAALDSLSEVQRLAIGDPSSVPAGTYAEAALAWLGWSDAIRPRLLTAKDVRACVRLVIDGEADAAIVYATDVRDVPSLRIVGRFPAESHPAIRLSVALVPASGADDDARRFLDALTGETATRIFATAGFRVPADRPAHRADGSR